MAKLIKLSCDENSDILVQVDPLPGEVEEVGLEENFEKAKQAFGNLSDNIVNTCKSFVNIIKKVDKDIQPDEMIIDFGIKLGAEGNVFVVKSSAEANFNISFCWKKV